MEIHAYISSTRRLTRTELHTAICWLQQKLLSDSRLSRYIDIEEMKLVNNRRISDPLVRILKSHSFSLSRN